MNQLEIEEKIVEIFEQNYELLRLDGGHALTQSVKENALNQVLYYYKKLSSVANKVTDTEVKLTLPDQLTPEGRRFTIEGIVDIVREDDEVWMYDIKTHDPDYIVGNKEYYEKQLNVYAHIYENLRGNKLDHTAVISTAFPKNLKAAIVSNDEKRIEREFEKWQPLIELEYKDENIAATIADFACKVDDIENNKFSPPPLNVLKSKVAGSNILFASKVCGNCDARFLCESFREYALQTGTRTQSNFKKYFEDFGNELEQEEFLTANINLDKINSQPETPQ